MAACADHHYLIAKRELEDHTVTSVELLEGKAIVEHLAIMMTGKMQEDSIKAAENLLQEGQRI